MGCGTNNWDLTTLILHSSKKQHSQPFGFTNQLKRFGIFRELRTASILFYQIRAYNREKDTIYRTIFKLEKNLKSLHYLCFSFSYFASDWHPFPAGHSSTVGTDLKYHASLTLGFRSTGHSLHTDPHYCRSRAWVYLSPTNTSHPHSIPTDSKPLLT